MKQRLNATLKREIFAPPTLKKIKSHRIKPETSQIRINKINNIQQNSGQIIIQSNR